MLQLNADFIPYLLVLPGREYSNSITKYPLPIEKVEQLPPTTKTEASRSITCDLSTVSLMALQVVSEEFIFIPVLNNDSALPNNVAPNFDGGEFQGSWSCAKKIIDAENMKITLTFPFDIECQN